MPANSSESDTQNTVVDVELQPPIDVNSFSDDNASGLNEKFEVMLEPQDDPKELPSIRKWLAVLTICSASLCTTFASSAVGLDRVGGIGFLTF